VPPIAARLTWTSNTDMNTLTCCGRPLCTSSSGADPIMITLPSAGEHAVSGSPLHLRSGLRKKNMPKTPSAMRMPPITGQPKNHAAAPTHRGTRMKGHPSGAIIEI